MKKNMVTGFSVLGIFLVMLVFLAGPAFAVSNPGGCFSTGVSISLVAFRADGVTPIAAGSVESGEQIKYQAVLSNSAPNCYYEFGTLSITTPDSVVHDVTPGGGIPLVTYVSPFISSQVNYIVTESDVGVDNDLDASTNYSGGTSWLGEGISPVGAFTPSQIPYVDVTLVVEKTAVPSVEESYAWTIDKSVTPSTWELFAGDSGTSEYTITVTKTLDGSSYAVDGVITITNPADFATATITSVSDEITAGIIATVDCNVTFPYDLGPGDSLVCSYSSALPDDGTRLNVATANTSGDVGSSSGFAWVDFNGVNPSIVNESIEVTDTNPSVGPWNFSESGLVSYEKTFDCADVEYTDNHAMYVANNTATIVQTQDSDSAEVTVHCYTPSVTKNASTEYTRTYLWNVEKSASVSEVTLALGEQYLAEYSVTATMAGSTDSDWVVDGTITVTNNHPTQVAIVNSVTDLVSGGINPSVDCNVSFPYSIPALGSLVCSYSGALPDGTTRTNTATATQQNHDYDSDLNVTDSGTTDYSGSASVTFSSPSEEIDETVTVTDSMYGALGTVSVGESPKVFDYSLFIGPYDANSCGDVHVDNTATLVANDTNTTDTVSKTIVVHVACEVGCTLTQGYWKTHSEFGKAPYDDTWALLSNGASTTFYLSGQTWYTVFKTAPKGNAYYQLAHQYEAAYLNVLNGAGTTPAVDTAMSDANALFSTYTPSQIGAMKANNSVRKQFVTLAGILGSYNEGLTGPGHCSEDSTSSP